MKCVRLQTAALVVYGHPTIRAPRSDAKRSNLNTERSLQGSQCTGSNAFSGIFEDFVREGPLNEDSQAA